MRELALPILVSVLIHFSLLSMYLPMAVKIPEKRTLRLHLTKIPPAPLQAPQTAAVESMVNPEIGRASCRERVS
jgi:hypothetical protein